MNERIKEIGIIIAAILIIIGFGIVVVESKSNHAIVLEENIENAKSDISIEVKRKNKLFDEIIAAANSYKEYEADTLKEVVEARKSNSTTDQEKALNVIVEAYPELKADENYSKMITEFSITENRIADHQKTYNNSINSYNKYVRKFPNKQLLSLKGYEIKEYERLEFDDIEEYDTSKI